MRRNWSLEPCCFSFCCCFSFLFVLFLRWSYCVDLAGLALGLWSRLLWTWSSSLSDRHPRLLSGEITAPPCLACVFHPSGVAGRRCKDFLRAWELDCLPLGSLLFVFTLRPKPKAWCRRISVPSGTTLLPRPECRLSQLFSSPLSQKQLREKPFILPAHSSPRWERRVPGPHSRQWKFACGFSHVGGSGSREPEQRADKWSRCQCQPTVQGATSSH